MPGRALVLHALTTQGHPSVPLCGAGLDGEPINATGVRDRVTCEACLRAMRAGLPWQWWKESVEAVLRARRNTTSRRYPLVTVDGSNYARWFRRWQNGMTPEEAVNDRLRLR